MTRVSVVDDDRMLLDGMAAWFSSVEDLVLGRRVRTVDELLADGGPAADVVVLDLLLADGSDPVRNVRRLVETGSRVLVVSVVPHGERGIDVVRAGAVGYLTKDHDLDVLADAVRSAAAGETVHSPELAFAWCRSDRPDRPQLSTQERAVLLAYASGLTLATAARQVGIRPATAKGYLDRVKEKYARAGRPAYTKVELAARVREDGIA
ncbi:transcriptional regulator [Actinophytocola xanthii]|uniref:response regulator transcription factor n=1 Tax=Actinophytocola xanthii TaxID=1912961 RepID=UPI001178648F|nr:response regulator transcription factor [Actinophytocola xanthii]